jgi:phosphoserine phosphatase
VLCNHFEVDGDGQLTGGIVEPIVWGAGKTDAVRRFAAQHDVDLANSYFYADGDEDIPSMRAVGRPRPVNPRSGLAAEAVRHGWPVLLAAGSDRRRMPAWSLRKRP